jgi:hypothetical protein
MRDLIKITAYLTVVASAFVISVSGRHITSHAHRDRLADAILLQFPLAERLECAASGHDSNVEDDTLALTVAIAGVESYARPRWMRFANYVYVVINKRLFDRLPDVSMGPAQIRISNIRKIAEPQNIVPQWIDLISDECANMSIAYCFVEELRSGQPLGVMNIVALAQLYNGQRHSISAEGSLQYVDLVSRIFSIVRARLDETQSLWSLGRTNHRHICR